MKASIPTSATIGANTIVEPDVVIGFQYHKDAGPAVVGAHGIFRLGTIVYGDVSLGDYFQSGHYAIIRAKVRAGNYCTVCNHSALEGIVRMGDGVRIMSHVYVPSRTWFGDHVFVGPGVTFLNDRAPGRWENGAPEPRGAFVENDVVIGGGCTILPGIKIGERSFVAAGALVTKDIPSRSMAIGSPARITPLPAALDRINDRDLTIQPVDLWHPLSRPDASRFPPEWPLANDARAQEA